MSNHFVFSDTNIPGVNVIQRNPLGDSRGYLERLFCKNEFDFILENRQIVQINHTLTSKTGTIRGLHFQYPLNAEMKFVSCIKGEVFDVAVDLRTDSATYLKWHAEILSGKNFKTLVIPEGFAHGFQTLTDDCEMLYLHTEAYVKSSEGAVNAFDPTISIQWPLEVTEQSERDKLSEMINNNFKGIRI